MRSIFLAFAVVAVFAARADAEIRLIDPATGASTTVVEHDYTRLVARFGESLVVRSARTGDAELVGPGGSRTRVPRFDHARSIGPGGRTLDSAGGAFELRAPDGQLVATLTTSSLWASFDPGSPGRRTGRGSRSSRTSGWGWWTPRRAPSSSSATATFVSVSRRSRPTARRSC